MSYFVPLCCFLFCFFLTDQCSINSAKSLFPFPYIDWLHWQLCTVWSPFCRFLLLLFHWTFFPPDVITDLMIMLPLLWIALLATRNVSLSHYIYDNIPSIVTYLKHFAGGLPNHANGHKRYWGKNFFHSSLMGPSANMERHNK